MGNGHSSGSNLKLFCYVECEIKDQEVNNVSRLDLEYLDWKDAEQFPFNPWALYVSITWNLGE